MASSRARPKLLAPGRAHGRRDLHDDDLVGVGEGVEDLLRVVALAQRADGTVR